MKRTRLLLCLALAACSATEPASERPAGTVARGLSLAVPGDFATIQAAIDAAAAGDVVAVAAGVYAGDLALRPGVVVRGAGAEKTVIRGRVTASAANGAGLADLTLDGKLAGAGADGVTAASSGLLLDRVTITGFAGRGVLVTGGGAATHLDRVRVTHCGTGVELSAKSSGAATITNAILAFNGSFGVHVTPTAEPAPVVAHALLLANGFGAGAAGSGARILTSTKIAASIVTSNYLGIDCAACTGGQNIVWGNVADYASSPLPGDLKVDPRLVAPADGDYHLRPDSPALDAAPAGLSATDLDGVARPQGAAADIGPYERPVVEVPALVITEVMANPLDEATGEYVELYNPGDAPVDAAGLVLDDGDSTDPIVGLGGGTVIPAGGYAVVLDPGYPGGVYDIPAEAVLLTVPGATLGSGLSTADPVTLRSADGAPLDTYGHPFDPGNGVSVEKDEVADGDVPSNWVASPCGASPGRPNCASEPAIQGPPPALVVTEVLANPLDEGTGEFVELLNVGLGAIDLAGAVISDGDATDTLAGWGGGATVLAPGQYAVVLDPDYAGQYAIPQSALLLTVASTATIGNGLSTDDPITVTVGAAVATFGYPSDPGNGVSLERKDPAAPDGPGAFAASVCASGSSPGEPPCAPEAQTPPPATVVVSEVMANPLDEDTGEFGELYNHGSGPVDLAGFLLSDGDVEEPLVGLEGGGGTVLGPGEYAVVLDREYAGEYAIPTGALLLSTPDTTVGTGLALDDVVTVRPPGGAVVSGYAFPFNPGNGTSAERVDLLAADLPGNWVASPCKASPGAPNCGGVQPTVGAPVVVAGLLITEVLANPLDEGTGEYVELYNAGPEALDLKGWLVSDGDATDAILGYGGGTVLQPGAFAVLLDKDYAGQYAIAPGTLLLTVGDAALGSGLATSDPVTIATPGGEVAATFSFPANPGNGIALEVVTLLGGDGQANWRASACAVAKGDANTGGSPGRRSCGDVAPPATGTRGVGQPCPNGGADCASGLCAVSLAGEPPKCTQDCAAAACPPGAVCLESADPVWTDLCIGDGSVVAPAVRINELVYDGPGTDVDVFVELRGAPGTVLDGVELVGINGATGDAYNAIPLAGQIGADGYFVVAHPKANAVILAAADLTSAKVDYQNGPDSVALRFGGGVVDAVGYGAFGAGDVFAGEGTPAPDQAPGQGLSRIPDGADTGDNGADFALADPTPGAENGVAVVAPAIAKLLITEVVISPTAAEMVEIHNPNAFEVDLSNVWISDHVWYWKVTFGEGKPDAADFRARFPAGASIPAGGYVTVSFETAAHFHAVYGVLPDYDLSSQTLSAPALVGEYTGSASLSNTNEVMALFYWDGASDLVTDLDYVLWGNAGQAVVRTGVKVGSSTYAPDTPQGAQVVLPAPGEKVVTRCDYTEGAQKAGGNGIGGSDETSEDVKATFQLLPKASPGGPGDCAVVCVPDCGGAQCGDDGCGGQCGVCGGGQICEEGQCITPAGPLGLTKVTGWTLPEGAGEVEEVVLFTSAAEFQAHFGVAPPVSFATHWAIFWSAGLRNVPGHVATVTEVVDNTVELFVFTELQLPGEGCEVLDWKRPAWTLVTFPKPASGATALTVIHGEDEVSCAAGGVPKGSECSDTALCKAGLVCCGLSWDFGLCFDAWMHQVFPGQGAAIPPGGTLFTAVTATGLASVPMDAIVKLHITHPNPSQLTISLDMPHQWDGEPTYEDVFWDQVAVSSSELLLHLPVGFVGDEQVNGAWTLKVVDHGASGGTLVDWSLELTSRWD